MLQEIQNRLQPIQVWILLLLCLDVYNSHGQSFNWARSMGSTMLNNGASLCVDPSGSVYSVGSFTGSGDFNSGSGVTTLSSEGYEDIFIQKLSADGEFLWAKSIGSGGYDKAINSCIDASGNIYIIGTFSDTVDFDPGLGVTNLITNGPTDPFVLKLDSNGDFIWARSFVSPDLDYAYDIICDDSGNVYTCGSFQDSADFDPGTGVFNVTTSGSLDMFIHKMDSNGNFVWVRTFGAEGEELANAIDLDSAGNLHVLGFFADTVDFDPGPGMATLIGESSGSQVILKLDGSGDLVWARSFGGGISGGDMGGADITVDGQGNVYSTGTFSGTEDFNPGPGVASLSSQGATDYDVFILKLSQYGNFNWVKSITGPMTQQAYSIDVDDSGYVYSSGLLRGTGDFDPGPGTVSFQSVGGTDLYLHKLDSAGNYVWSTSFGSTGSEIARTILLDEQGNIYVGGTFSFTVDFNSGTGVDTLVMNGSRDVFALKLGPCTTVYAIDVQVVCDSLLWTNGEVYTSSNFTATDTLINSVGCDSIVTLNLTVINSTSAIDTITACDTFTWIDGMTYTSSNFTATDTLINAAGCDSIVSLNLTIIHSTYAIDTIVACDSLTWIDGVTYTESNNTAIDTLVNAAGCDSIITLHLTILNSTSATDTVTACDSYTWIDGNTYTASNNTATHTILNNVGCDSVVTLDLTVNYSVSSTDTISACNEFTWTVNDSTYLVSGEYQASFSTTAGCDSILTLQLNILENDSTTLIESSCDFFYWAVTSETYFESGVFDTLLTNSLGCDSLVILDLQIISLDTQVIVFSSKLKSQESSSHYQWYDCDIDSILLGENDSVFTPAQTGSYAVILSKNGCVDTSECYSVKVSGIKDQMEMFDYGIYPNPSKDLITISTSKVSTDLKQIRIYNTAGQLVIEEVFKGTSKDVRMSELPVGVYHLEVIPEGRNDAWRTKLVVQ